MEGPTPVSALIHAATMVAAGVYLMARTFPLLEQAPAAMTVVAIIGGFTALFAATMGLVATDIKRVLAFSTVSQLGYMLLGIGVGAMSAGIFHLFNHAFFKALLFLCAGSLIHLVETNDLFKMGGLRSLRPVTHLTMLIGALSLAGLFPLSGFWSKDEILVAAAAKQPVLFVMAMATVALTAFYMFRAFFLAFSGSYRGEHPLHDQEVEPPSMTIPLLVLLVPSIISGLWGLPFFGNPFGTFLEGHQAHTDFRWEIAVLSNALAAAGGLLAWKLYGNGSTQRAAALSSRVRPAHALLEHGYYLDRPVALPREVRRWFLYNWLVETIFLGVAKLATWFDVKVVDGAVNGGGALTLGVGSWSRRLQTGQVQTYGWVFFAGAVAIALVLVIPRIVGQG
jgi:NADH-quinone oxidoreductase subunit L